MKKFTTEYDELVDALSRCNLNEDAIPVKAGCVIHDVDSYNKIQRLLEIDEFEPSHKFLYNLDVDMMSDKERAKVNQLYKLAQDKGFVDLDEPEDDVIDDIPATDSEAIGPDYSEQTLPVKPQTGNTLNAIALPDDGSKVATPVKDMPQVTSAYTVYYSAMKNGQIKTGECFSNALNPTAAKSDCINKLYRAGFDNITVLAVDVNDEEYRDSETPITPRDVDAPLNSIPLESDDEEDEETDEDEDVLDEDDLEEAANEKYEDAETFFDKVKSGSSSSSDSDEDSEEDETEADDDEEDTEEPADDEDVSDDDETSDDEDEDNDSDDDDSEDEEEDEDDDEEKDDTLGESLVDIDFNEQTDYLAALKVSVDSYLKNRKPGPIEVTIEQPRIKDGADVELYYAIVTTPEYGITSFEVLRNDNISVIKYTFASLAKFSRWLKDTDYEDVVKLFINGKQISNPMEYMDTLANPNVFEDDNDIDQSDEEFTTEAEDDKEQKDDDEDEDANAENTDDSGEEAEGDMSDEETTEEPTDDDSENTDEETSDTDEPEQKPKDEEIKLTADEKKKLANEYTKAWKDALGKCKFKIPFSELTLDQKIKFFEQLANIWGDKPDSTLFLKEKDVKKLNEIKVRL